MARLLVLDDDQPIRELVEKVLEFDGHEVETGGTSEEGLALFAENDYEVVITDLLMPIKGGLEVVRQVKSTRPHVGVIVVAGRGDKEVLEVIEKYEGVRVLQKPIDLGDLKTAIRELSETSDEGEGTAD